MLQRSDRPGQHGLVVAAWQRSGPRVAASIINLSIRNRGFHLAAVPARFRLSLFNANVRLAP